MVRKHPPPSCILSEVGEGEGDARVIVMWLKKILRLAFRARKSGGGEQPLSGSHFKQGRKW